MNDSTNDDKIQQLVRSVLEAVDTRLTGVRAEMLAAANDVQHRHQQLLDTVVSLQQRVDLLVQQRGAQDATIAALRADLVALRSAPAAAAPAPALAPVAAASLEPPSIEPRPEPPRDLSGFTRPLMNDVHVTSQLPIVPMIQPMSFDDRHTGEHRTADSTRFDSSVHATAPHDVLVERDDREATAWANAGAESQAADELIDLERLTRLLSDKLEHITLPRPE